jgi:hypothetical protein
VPPGGLYGRNGKTVSSPSCCWAASPTAGGAATATTGVIPSRPARPPCSGQRTRATRSGRPRTSSPGGRPDLNASFAAMVINPTEEGCTAGSEGVARAVASRPRLGSDRRGGRLPHRGRPPCLPGAASS